MTLFQKDIVPMAQEGHRVVARKEPIRILPQMKIISTEEEGMAVADLLGNDNVVMMLGHGAVTASTQSVQDSVMTMAWLEHQAEYNYMGLCAGGPNHPSIPWEIATQPSLGEPPHIAKRVAQLPGAQRRFDEGGVWAYIREIVSADM
jgi:ribulose-5-phosphate 4-epimerase/fuculose-1-phosphate aldolase